MLIGLLVPAVQKVRAAAARASCGNNLKQLGLALHNYEGAAGRLPTAFPGNPPPPYETAPAYFHTWSALAQLTPYLEQTAVYNRLDMNLPLYSPANFLHFPENRFALGQKVRLFLCPADTGRPLGGGYGVEEYGPTNYAACTGSGTTAGGPPLGSPWEADGLFRARDPVRLADVADGTSNTAAIGESTLGEGPESASGPIPGNPQKVYAYLSVGTTLTDQACEAAHRWNVDKRRGYLWATGEVRSGSYNHYLRPNDPRYDCVTNLFVAGRAAFTAAGLKAARSNHTGGVNLLLADGSVRFVRDGVGRAVWRAAATRAGGEVATLD